jgi:hypothetical protein
VVPDAFLGYFTAAAAAAGALIGLLFVSLLALMPHANLGFAAAILAGYSLYRTLQLPTC